MAYSPCSGQAENWRRTCREDFLIASFSSLLRWAGEKLAARAVA
jgi:hypothetical protein